MIKKNEQTQKLCNLKGKTLMIMIRQKVKSYVCTFQGYIYLNTSMSVFVSIFVANECWADYDFLVYKISLKK